MNLKTADKVDVLSIEAAPNQSLAQEEDERTHHIRGEYEHPLVPSAGPLGVTEPAGIVLQHLLAAC